jgi:chromosome segregation ATPase
MTSHIKHLIIAGLVAVVVCAVAWKAFAFYGNKAHDDRVLAEQTVKEDLEKAKVQAAATASDKQALQGQLTALAASNDALRRDMAALRSELANQRSKNDSMAPSDLSAHWSMLIGLPGEVTPAANGILATLPAAHATVNQLEEIPVLKGEKKKIADDSAKKDDAIAQALKTLGSTTAELDTCKNHTVPDAKKACDKEISEVKAKARKRNLFVAIVAAVGGFILRTKI